MTIGFIGLGIMGSRMARNLQKAGYQLVVHNRSIDKAAELFENGATWAKTPAEVGEQVDVLITMLSTPEVVQEIALGEDGIFDGLSAGKIWVDCSTVNPSFSKEMAEAATDEGIHFIDAPVAGTKAPAEAGELLFLVGGDEADVTICQPLFDIMGKATSHLGAHGAGASMKMLINLMLGQSILAFAEAMQLGKSMGLAEEMLFNVLLKTPVVAPVLSVLRPKLEAGNWETNFPLKWMQKDLQLASQTAYENEVPMPSLNVAKEVFAMAKISGFGDLDFSSVYAFLEK